MSLPDPWAIREIDYAEWARRFGPTARRAKLPTKDVPSSTWYASEVACGGITWVSATNAHLTRATTLEEWQGMGYGAPTIWYRFALMRNRGIIDTMQISRTPHIYTRAGFEIVGRARNGSYKLAAKVPDIVFPDDVPEWVFDLGK